MPKTKISEFDVDPANNTDINSINIAEGCAPSGINNAIRQLMSDLKEFQTGAGGDPFNGAVNGTVGATTPASGAFTTLSASGAFSANGGATLGDASGDALTINSSAVSIPNGLNFDSNTFVIDAANNNVGIGTASPAAKLDVITGTNSGLRVSDGTYTGTFVPSSLGGMAITTGGAYPLIYYINGSERMRIDSSGNVGIGTSAGITTVSSGLAINNATAGNYPGLEIQTAGVTRFYINANNAASYISSQSTNPMVFQTNGTERMRIDSSGALLVGTTSTFDNVSFLKEQVLGGISTKINGTGATSQMSFFNDNGRVGFIGSSGTSTSYNTSSDYRLKENIAPMTGALDVVQQLKPVTYTWKANGSQSQGFIAHELQEVVPDCVTGEKDAVDAEGKPVYQGIDTSFLVATLTAAIKEQQAIITDLKERIVVLESK